MAKVLIVDDEPSFGELLKTLLKSHGHDALTATNGRDGVAAFKEHRPHFTLLDLRMPEMDGLEVLKQIRQIDAQAAVMILTAWGSDEMEQKARLLGATDFLSKTLSLDTILTSLARGLKPPPPPEKDAVPQTDAIFLAEGKKELLGSFSKFLSQHGMTVKAAKDGQTVLGMLDKELPQVIVLDMDIPGTKGLDVLKKLREKNYKGGIIIMTERQHSSILKESWDMSSVDILGKPVDPERLLLAIQVGLVLVRGSGS